MTARIVDGLSLSDGSGWAETIDVLREAIPEFEEENRLLPKHDVISSALRDSYNGRFSHAQM
jgi:hypothetical protein